MIKIALDFDGVLADTMKLWVFSYNKKFPTKKLTIKDINEWDFYKKEGINLTKEQAFEIFDFCWRHQEFLKSMERNLAYKIEMLGEVGRVDIVTAVVKNREPIRKWLARKNITNDVVFDMEKWKLNYDIYIDDSPIIATNVAKEGKMCLLMDQLWNRDVKTNGKIKRIYSLGQAYDVIKSLKTVITK